MPFKKVYRPLDKNTWQGRIDDFQNRDAFRWHQVVEIVDLHDSAIKPVPKDQKGFCFLGFCCDEGVLRNKGRRGAAKAPLSIRKEMANLPVYFEPSSRLFDAGDINAAGHDMETAQQALSEAVTRILALDMFPVLLGGGHEIAFGHFRGLASRLSNQSPDPGSNIGIINFDAHFDLRPYDRTGGSSGSSFLQVADFCAGNNLPFSYFCVGIQQCGNTRSLFNTADRLGAQYIMAKDIKGKPLKKACEKLSGFIAGCDNIYLSICSDVFSAADAPGVSAPQPLGLDPETVLTLIKHILKSGKTISLDIAEVSPRFDNDNQTAKLAAIIFFAVVNYLSS